PVPQCRLQQPLDQTGAGTAGAGCIGDAANVVHRRQTLGLDGSDDPAFADAVAATDLGIVAECRNGLARVCGGARSRECRPEDQGVACPGYLFAGAHELEIPGAIPCVAVENGAFQAPVLDHQPLVDTPSGVAEHDVLAIITSLEFAGG